MSRSEYSTFSSDRRGSNLAVIDPSDDSLFTVGLDDASTMTKILHELHHADDQSVLAINQDGIRVITAGEKVFQVSAFFARSIFQHFKFDTDHQVNFRFVLRDFIATLNLPLDDPIAEGDKVVPEDCQPNDYMKTSLFMQYRKKGEPIRMRLENKTNCVVECDLRAFNMPSNSVFCPLAFHDSEDFAMIHLNSKRLYEYVSGLDFTGEHVHVVMGRGEIPLKMCTSSTATGEVELEITNNETDIINKVVCENIVYNFSYKTQLIKPALEALRTSNSMRMKIGSSGLLCIEHFHEEMKQPCEQPTTRRTNGYGLSSQSSVNSANLFQPQNKISSVEYFIQSETKLEACSD